MVADMVADMKLDIVADMEVDKVAHMETQFGERVGQWPMVTGVSPNSFDLKLIQLAHLLSFASLLLHGVRDFFVLNEAKYSFWYMTRLMWIGNSTDPRVGWLQDNRLFLFSQSCHPRVRTRDSAK